MAVTARCRSCGCDLQPWESEFCEGCGLLFLPPATKGEPMSSDKMLRQMKMIWQILSMQEDMGCPQCNARTLRVEYNYEEILAIYTSTREQHRAWLARKANQ